MRLRISPLNGSREKVEAYLKQALPTIEINFDGSSRPDYDAVGVLEVSEFDPFQKFPQILERAGRNIACAIGSSARVLCHVDRNPEIKWANDPDGSW